MSKTMEYPLGTFGLRDQLDEILVPSAQCSMRHCHIPASSEGEETLCKHLTRVNVIRRKDIACYPDGHLNWCAPCLEEWGLIG